MKDKEIRIEKQLHRLARLAGQSVNLGTQYGNTETVSCDRYYTPLGRCNAF
jgi:hypothetical protein